MRAENGKGFSGQARSSWASNARKETYNRVKETRVGASMGEVSRNTGARTLPYQEYIKRREEGRCFHCGGSYSYGHRCPDKRLRLIIVWEDEEWVEDGEPGVTEDEGGEQDERSWSGQECQQIELSIFSAGDMT